jgi:hypothetical protein
MIAVASLKTFVGEHTTREPFLRARASTYVCMTR